MTIAYLAHPLAGDVPGNLARAKRWLRWAITYHPQHLVLAPWIVEAELFDESDPDQRAAAMRRCKQFVMRCGELWLVGGRVSAGMAEEREIAELAGVVVRDLTHMGEEPTP